MAIAALGELKIRFFNDEKSLQVFENVMHDVIPNVGDQVSLKNNKYIVESRHFDYYGSSKVTVEIYLKMQLTD